MTATALLSPQTRLLCAFAVSLFAGCPAAAQSQLAPGFVDRSLGNGVDQFTVLRRPIASAPLIDSSAKSGTLRASSVQFSDGAGWNVNGTRISALYRERGSSFATASSQIELALVSVNGRERFVGEASYAWRPLPSTGIEVMAASDWVDTPRAFDEGLTAKYIGAAIEQRLLPGLTAVALAGYQPVSDGNARTIAKGRLTYELLPQLGIALQAGYRRSGCSGQEVMDRYFNPSDFDEASGGIALHRSFAGIAIDAEARYAQGLIDGIEHAGMRVSFGFAASLKTFTDQMPRGSRVTLNGQYADGNGAPVPGLAGTRQLSIGLEVPL